MSAKPPPADRPARAGDNGGPPAREPNAAAAAEPATPAPGRARAGLAAPFAVALALLATMVAGALWWQYREFYVVLHAADAELQSALERVRANDRRVADQVEDLRADVEAGRGRSEVLAEQVGDLPGRFADLERRLGELPAQFAALERQFDAAQGGSVDTRAAWLRAEAEYYLTLANAELELAGRWHTATTALELADDRLRALSDPTLARVRERIADELLALKGIDVPDVDGLAFTLGRLAERVDELPLRDAAPTRFEQPVDALDDTEPGLSRLWLGIRSALSGIISIERNEDRPPPISAERRALATRQLGLELQLARIAALRAQRDAFEASLTAAAALLERDFDSGAAAVRNAAAVIGDMLAVDVAPARPDISGSLALLRSLPTGSD